MTVELLIQSLENIELCYLGDGNSEVFDVMRWDESQFIQDDILYVMDISHEVPIADNIVAVEAAHIDDALMLLRKRLVDDYRMKEDIIHLNSAIENESTMEEIMRLSSKVMGDVGSIFLFTPYFSLVGSYGKIQIQEILPAILQRKDWPEISDIVKVNSEQKNSAECIVSTLRRKGVLTGYVLWAKKGDIKHPREVRRRLNLLRQVLVNLQNIDKGTGTASARERFLISVINSDKINSKLVSEQKRELKFPEYDKYYVLSFKKKKETTVFMRDKLQSVVGEEIYEYRQHYFAIVGCQLSERISENTWPKLKDFLSENKMFAGLSNGFLDFDSLKIAFEQSVVAVSLRKIVSNDKFLFCRYEDLILSHLLFMADRNNIPYESFCHPNVVYIRRYDEKHGTEYLKTLLTYVFNNLKPAETAAKLYIHRNTLYHRLNALKEQFGIDFENPREVMKLSISCTAYGFTNVVQNADVQFGQMD